MDIIELLNEGAGFLSSPWPSVIGQYYQDGYNVVRDAVGFDNLVMIGDAFLGVQVSIRKALTRKS